MRIQRNPGSHGSKKLFLIPSLHLIMLILIAGVIIWIGVIPDPRVTTVPLLVGFALSCGLLIHAVAVSYIYRYKPTLCRIRLSVNQDITLIYNSWWPRGLSNDEIKSFAIDAAMESAHTWYQGHEKEQRLCLSEHEAFELTIHHLSEFSEIDEPSTCPICLDMIEGGAARLKLCHHDYHEDCLVRWFHRSGKVICPYCRENHNEVIPVSLVRNYKEKSKPIIRIMSTEIEVDESD